jgi:hypothetical protein
MTRPGLARITSAILRLRGFIPARLAQADPFDLAVALLMAALVVLVVFTFKDYAISNDEEVQQRYGELIITYYVSGFADHALFHFKNLYLYGGLFDIVAVLLQHVLPMEPYDVRHILCALIGIAGIGAVWATTRMIAGPRAAAIAAATIAVCGPWYGPMFNHTKDIPFAAAMMGGIYFLCRIARDLPRPRTRDVVLFGLLLGAALGIRVTGLLMVGYAGVAILFAMPRPVFADWTKTLHFLWRSSLAIAPAIVIGYVVMIAAWPWAGIAPLNPIRAVTAFADFDYHIRTLMAGHIYEMGTAPRWYVPLYFLIKLPIVILAGSLFAIALASWRAVFLQPQFGAVRQRETAFLIFAVVFPLLCQVIGDGPAFTGIRHFLFVIPALAVLTGIGFDQILAQLEARRRAAAIGGVALIACSLIWNAATLVRMHPYEYLFYNPLIGGLEGAARQFDTDYWVNIMPEAVDDLQAFLDSTGKKVGMRPTPNYSVAVCGERVSFQKEIENDPRLAWTADWKQADFFIAPTHMNCDRALDGTVVATIERLGVPIGVVKDRRAITARLSTATATAAAAVPASGKR